MKKKLLKLRQLAAQLPQTSSGEPVTTAHHIEELTGLKAGTVYSAMSRGLLRAKLRLASTILFSTEDIIKVFGGIRPRKTGDEI